MLTNQREIETYNFGTFELNLRTGELRKQGVRLKLTGQPIQVLAILLEHAGKLVTREQLRERLWPNNSFGDFDHGLNNAILRIREVLGDSATSPRFIETLPRRGYRFLADVRVAAAEAESAPITFVPLRHVNTAGTRFAKQNMLIAVLTLVIIAVGITFWFYWRQSTSAKMPRRLAVLPFRNLTGSPEQEYLSDGMTEEMINALSRLSSLQVVSRTSVMTYKQPGKSLPQIAKELNVDEVLEGSILESGDKIRVTVQLRDARIDRQIWGREYNRDLRDILGMQNDISLDVAEQVKAEITEEERARLSGARQVDPEARKLFEKGRHMCGEVSASGYELCLHYMEQAIAKDPNYAEAYAGIAFAYDLLEMTGKIRAAEAMPKAKAAALRAIELDPTLAAAHVALGVILTDYDWNAAAGEKEFLRAIELEPSSGSAHHYLGWFYIARGQWNSAVHEFREGAELNPLSAVHSADLAMALSRAGRWKEAEHYITEARDLSPSSAQARYQIANAYLFAGRYDEGVKEFEKVYSLWNNTPFGRLGYAYYLAGRKTESRKVLEAIKKSAAEDPSSSCDLALLYAAMGEKRTAIAYITKAVDSRTQCALMLRFDPPYQTLETESEFQGLVRKIGFWN